VALFCSADATDRNIEASSASRLLITTPSNYTGSANLTVTGWTNMSAYPGNGNIPSSYFKITAYKLM